MTALPTTHFLFTVCQAGVEPALKQEVHSVDPDLHFAYNRKGFVTFKRTSGPIDADFRLESIFARAYGASLGAAESADAVIDVARSVRQGSTPLRLHVFERDAYKPGDEPEGHPEGAAAKAAEGGIREAAGRLEPGLFHDDPVARPGELVLDVIVAPGDSLWVGFHRHGPHHSPYPGGKVPLEVPTDIPSRAFRKLEEARIGFGIPFRKGDTAVEIGSSPGGAAYALLRQGVNVIGIDPGPMDPVVLNYVGPGGARLTHLPVLSGAVRREQLPRHLEWLLIDANLVPQVALHTAHRLADRMRPTLLGVIFTLKLNDWHQLVHIPSFMRRIEAMGVVEPKASQLPSNRQEICVYGLTGRGRKRVGGE